MAPAPPDLVSVPSSPRLSRASSSMSTASSRRPSHTTHMGPPAALLHSTGSTMLTSADAQIPIRHPRPMTAAELHLELEQEQEAVVNKLTRELSALRAQHSASVASNASHSSSSSHQLPSILPLDPSDPTTLGPTHPTPSRQRRSSSTASSRSLAINTPSTAASSNPTASAHLAGVSQASADRAAAAGSSLSRNPSMRSASGTNTPARASIEFNNLALPHRPSLSNATSFVSNAATVGSASGGSASAVSPSLSHAAVSPHINPTQYYADASHAKAELEIVKEENEALRQRVRALEEALRVKKRESQHMGSGQSDAGSTRERSLSTQSTHAVGPGVNITSWAAGATVAGPRERSESQSTTASSRRMPTVDDREDNSIRVGESAASGAASARPHGF